MVLFRSRGADGRMAEGATIEIGEQDNLRPVLSTLRQGIAGGELDKLLMDVS